LIIEIKGFGSVLIATGIGMPQNKSNFNASWAYPEVVYLHEKVII